MTTIRPDTTLPGSPRRNDDEPLIDAKALAAWLGVSEHTVRKWITKGPESRMLPRMLRVNGQIRFRPADIREWLDKCTVR